MTKSKNERGSPMTTYVAGYNLAGYLPDTEAMEFDDLFEAKEFLQGELLEFTYDIEETPRAERDDRYPEFLLDAEEALSNTIPSWEAPNTVLVGDWAFWIQFSE